ncbi:MAG TPA: DUF2207 domain-containing protein, partial [Bacillota bacterium]|nr:DUF2207 domain-containing protein [Bacillota bacterium]
LCLRCLRTRHSSLRDDTRPEGCCAVYEDNEGTHVEIYLSALDESHTITIGYTVYDAVILHDDVAEFRWNLTSSSEPVDISSLSAHITIPPGTDENGLYIWAHGPKNGQFDKVSGNDGTVCEFELYVTDIPSDTAVNIRMALPIELFPYGSRFEEGNALESIIAYEESYNLPDDVTPLAAGLSSVLLVFSLLSIVSMFTVAPIGSFLNKRVFHKCRMRKLRYTPQQAPKYYRSLPDDMKPAAVGSLMSVYDGENKTFIRKNGGAFAATLLDLIERGAVVLTPHADSTTMLKVNADAANLTSSEQALLDTLTAAGVYGNPLSTAEITEFLKSNPSVAVEKKKAFDDAVDAEIDALGLIEHREAKKLSRKAYWIITAALIAVSCVIGICSEISGGVMLSALVGALLAAVSVFCLTITKRIIVTDYVLLTQDGENRYAMWGAFARYLDDFTTFDDRELPDIKVWRRYLVYAAALGRSKKVTQSLRVKYPHFNDSSYQDDCWFYEQDIADFVDSVQSASYSVPDSGYDGGDGGGFSSSDGGSDSGSGGGDFD